MKNRMDVPQEYEPVLPGKVEGTPREEESTGNRSRLATHTDSDRRRESDYAAGACESQFAR